MSTKDTSHSYKHAKNLPSLLSSTFPPLQTHTQQGAAETREEGAKETDKLQTGFVNFVDVGGVCTAGAAGLTVARGQWVEGHGTEGTSSLVFAAGSRGQR